MKNMVDKSTQTGPHVPQVDFNGKLSLILETQEKIRKDQKRHINATRVLEERIKEIGEGQINGSSLSRVRSLKNISFVSLVNSLEQIT